MIWVEGFGSPPILLRRAVMAQMSKYDRLVKSLAAKDKKKSKGARNPKALAAWIGRKKLGKAEFQRRAAAGRRGSK
jgi:hypothetical protein